MEEEKSMPFCVAWVFPFSLSLLGIKKNGFCLLLCEECDWFHQLCFFYFILKFPFSGSRFYLFVSESFCLPEESGQISWFGTVYEINWSLTDWLIRPAVGM